MAEFTDCPIIVEMRVSGRITAIRLRGDGGCHSADHRREDDQLPNPDRLGT
jgi:hypothetical protein